MIPCLSLLGLCSNIRRLGGVKNRRVFLTVLEAGFEIKMPTD